LGIRVATFAVAALALASCGDASGHPGYSPVVSEPLSKVEFLRQADQICNASEAQIEAAADGLVSGPGKPDPAEVKRVATSIVVPRLQAEIAAIRALGAPPGDEAKVQAILDATQDGVDQIDADPEGLVDGQVPRGLRDAEKLARAYGSQECGIR
jgi:hypothetical protein